MEQLVLAVPSMWADHHVSAVRDLLNKEEGVEVAFASALEARVSLAYDPSVTDPRRIAAALEGGGYAVGEPAEAPVPPPNKPAWATAAARVTTTDPADLSMSGDHRQY
jgi:hypothetical protein